MEVDPGPSPGAWPHLWLIGGTAESKALAQALVAEGIPTIVTVTTDAARQLYPQHPLLTVQVGRLGSETFGAFVRQWQVTGILDASHPFATEISKGAIATSQQHNLPYLRYERPPLPVGPNTPNCPHTVPDLETLFDQGLLAQQRVLVVLGYRHLTAFAPWQDSATLYARILPSVIALTTAQQAGFSTQRLVALRPPVTRAVEAALWQQWNITTVVAKASGAAGGEVVKRQLAQALNVNLILLARPMVDYPKTAGNMEETLKFCRQITPHKRP